ncbi:MAG TPA: tetratricopeptide repeat protein, partial [Burkholderiales bacterium]|nr:tetratricopeptide repeat protein [Burkholderiales bacterium]
ALNLDPQQADFAMTLARLQVEMGHNGDAVATLKAAEPYASGNPDFLAFMAVMLQRAGDDRAAITYFRNALSIKQSVANWWLGLAISLEKTRQPEEALAAFRRAIAAGGLSPSLQAFADRRIAFLGRSSAESETSAPPRGTGIMDGKLH